MKTKTEIRFFFLPDFEKEENYLAEEHRKGWKFQKNRMGFLFVFEKCPPEDKVYQLDVRHRGQDKIGYIQMFADYGWEYVGDCYQFSYFRKSRLMGETEIYSDRRGKLDRIGRLIGGQFVCAISLFSLFTFLFSLLEMPAGVIGIAMVTIPVLMYCLVGLLRLCLKYREVGS